MDSVTQAVLGAAVQHAVQHRQLGRRALVWGAVFGTLPDLDILFSPWQSAVEQLAWHRGISHSLFLMILTSPLWAGLMTKLHRETTFFRAWVAVFLVLLTHVLIDCFTVYGTQVWEPFNNTRVAFNNLFIIDPLYTLPLLAGCGAAVLWGRKNPARATRATMLGLALSTAYAGWSLAAKAVVNAKVERQLEREGFSGRWQSTPTAFNTLLWRILVDEERSCRIGYLTVWKPAEQIAWTVIPRHGELLEALPEKWRKTLVWFSCGYYALKPEAGGVVFSDLRFGEVPPAFQSATRTPDFFFSWKFQPGEGEPGRELLPRDGSPRERVLFSVWKRIWNSE